LADQCKRIGIFERSGSDKAPPKQQLQTFYLQKSRSKSLGSLRTISTAVSDETTEALARGDKNAAHYRGVLVWAKVHQASMVMSGENDHIAMKAVCQVIFVYTLSLLFVVTRHDTRKPEYVLWLVFELGATTLYLALQFERQFRGA
jgi:hypothetical protein